MDTLNDIIAVTAERIEDTFPQSPEAQDIAELLRSVWKYEPDNVQEACVLAQDQARHNHHTDDVLQRTLRVLHNLERS